MGVIKSGLTVASVAALAFVGCSSTESVSQVGTTDGGSEVAGAPPILPVVDDDGTAWFVAAQPDSDGAYSVVAADSNGWSASVLLGATGPAGSQPAAVAAPSGNGILVATTSCVDEECAISDLAVSTIERDAESIVVIGEPWTMRREKAATDSAPRGIATGAGVSLIQDNLTLVTYPTQGEPTVSTLPEAGGDPCLSEEGRITAVEVVGANEPEAGEATVIDPNQGGTAGPTLQLVGLDANGIAVVPDSARSWQSVYRTNYRFFCGPTGSYYAEVGQLPTLAWNKGWSDLAPKPVEWDLTAKSTARGPIGVARGSLVLLDPLSGESLASIGLPAATEAVLSESAATSEADGVPLGGWLAIGGHDLGTGAICLGEGVQAEVTCTVFS